MRKFFLNDFLHKKTLIFHQCFMPAYDFLQGYPFSALIFSVKAGMIWKASPTTP